MKTIMILMAFISLVGCFFIKNQPTAKWEMISPKGLNGYIEDPKDPRYPGYPDKVLPFFVSDSVGFLYGITETSRYRENYPSLLKTKAIIYKTVNGGYNWRKYEFGDETLGCYTLFQENNTIRSIIEFQKGGTTFFSYKGSWQKENDLFIKEQGILMNLENDIFDFNRENNKKFIIIAYEDKTYYLSKDDRQTWEKHKFPFEAGSINPESIYWGEHECWFTSWKGKQCFLGHLDFEKNTGGLEELNFSGEVVALSPTGKIWIAGKEDKDAVLYERESKGKYNLVKRVNYGGGDFYLSSDFLNVNNDEQIWVYSDVKFFPENHFMSSQDGGKTWTEENMPYSASFKNPYFLHDKKQHKTLVWVNVGGGRLMMRK